MGRHSTSLVIFCMAFGFLIGIAGFLGVAFLGGFVDRPEAEAVSSGPQYASATERLEAYRCRAAETKMIVMGGIEDGFDPAGEENVTVPRSLVNYLDRISEPDQILYKTQYDDPAQNFYFGDQFDIPARAFRGMIAIRLEERSNVKNDTFSIGYYNDQMTSFSVKQNAYSGDVSDLFKKREWQQDKSYVWADLDDLNLFKMKTSDEGADRILGKSHETLLDAIRRQRDEKLHVYIADDTIVDFIGFALCLEPLAQKGTLFSRYHHSGKNGTFIPSESFVSLYSMSAEQGGFVSCDEERPLSCIKDLNLTAPDEFSNLYGMLWSGGEIKFTKPVQGNQFETEDEVDAYCAAQFGPKWRVLNAKDGAWTGAIFGYGEYPESHDNFWISYKDAPHHNCWELRQDYDDLAAQGAQNE